MIQNFLIIQPNIFLSKQKSIFDATGRLTREAEFNPAFFLRCIQQGNILFVGEGNLSFVSSLAQLPNIPSQRITASVYEDKIVSKDTAENAELLKKLGISVQCGVDATKLDQHYQGNKFSTIIFQFPHTGSRDPLYGHNPNFVLIRRFLKSAAPCLEEHGQILISAVDNPHYQGAFQFEEAAKETGYKNPETLCFEPSSFPGYTHSNTHDDGSALDSHNKFKTWLFRKK